MKNIILSKSEKKTLKNRVKDTLILMKKAISAAISPLSDFGNAERNFLWSLKFFSQRNRDYFENLFAKELQKRENEYYRENENGYSAYDMDMAMLYGG